MSEESKVGAEERQAGAAESVEAAAPATPTKGMCFECDDPERCLTAETCYALHEGFPGAEASESVETLSAGEMRGLIEFSQGKVKSLDAIESEMENRPPESYCHECGRDNPHWFAPNDAFNRLVPSRTGIMCPTCFLLRDKTDTYWIVMPEGHETVLAGQLAESGHEIRELREKLEAANRRADQETERAIKAEGEHFRTLQEKVALSADNQRLRKALAEVGNLSGGPTMNYSPEIERKELLKRLPKIAEIVSKALTEGNKNG